jgi:AraC-like DNA-binding protein
LSLSTSGRRRVLAGSLLLDELFSRLAAAPARDPRIIELCGRVFEDPGAAPTVDEPARFMAASRRSFSRAFRGVTRTSWSAWVRQVRLARAVALMAGGARMSEAAEAVGYGTASGFQRRLGGGREEARGSSDPPPGSGGHSPWSDDARGSPDDVTCPRRRGGRPRDLPARYPRRLPVEG